jgi:hypothetical protein
MKSKTNMFYYNNNQTDFAALSPKAAQPEI